MKNDNYFTIQYKGAGMGQTFNDFKFLYGVFKGMTDLKFSFSNLGITHNCGQNIPLFNNYFGLSSFSEKISDKKFDNYKRIDITIPEIIKEFGIDPQKAKLNLNKKEGTMYVLKNWSDGKIKGSPLGPWGKCEKKLRHDLWQIGNRGEWLNNPILKQCFSSKHAVEFRKKIQEQSLFKNTEGEKLLICYRLGDTALQKNKHGVKDYLFNKSYGSWEEALKARQKTCKPFIETESYLRDINNYLKFNLNEKEIKMHTDAIQIALNNTPNGKIVSWHNGDRLSSGKVRIVKTYYKNDKY